MRDSVVYIFVIAFLEKCKHDEALLTDFDVIISHLTEEKNASFYYKTKDLGLSETLDHLKFSNMTNIFSYVPKFVFRSFGSY